MNVGVIVVNYKTADLTIGCLKSLVNEREHIDFDVIVVDNNSRDGSVEKIESFIAEEGYHDWVELANTEKNGGFAYGNNVAINKIHQSNSLPPYILLLNPDTIIYPGAIAELASFLDKNNRVGIVGSRIEEENGLPQLSLFKFHTWISELERGFSLGILTKLLSPWVGNRTIPNEPVKADWVSGASMMVRSSIFNQIGRLDESYFMYYEETDFCLRAARAGWECWYVPQSRIVHYVGQSSGINNGNNNIKRLPQYWFESRRRFFLKNYGFFHAFLADVGWLLGFFTWRLRNVIQRKIHHYPPFLWLDMFKNSVLIRGKTLN